MFKLLLSCTFIVLSLFKVYSQPEVIVNVVFENPNKVSLSNGKLTIIETQEVFELNSISDFSFNIEKPGNFTLAFSAPSIVADVYQPKIFNKGVNHVTITLAYDIIFPLSEYSYPQYFNRSERLSKIDLEEMFNNGSVNFIINGLLNTITPEMQIFKDRYGVGFVFGNCVIDPITFKRTRDNNVMIQEFLNEKIGLEWKAHLPVNPFGLN